MTILQLVYHEILHRWGTFVLALLSVACATACLVAAVTILTADDIHTRVLLAQRTADVEAAGAALEDSMRKITKGLGFNILILASEENLADLQLDGIPSGTMPESYVAKLASSRIVSINHLLPIVTERITWSERQRDVILTGTRGEVPLMHRALKAPLLDQVPQGEMVVGYRVANPSDKSKPGIQLDETVSLLGEEFKVTKIHDERGNQDDSTIWIHLTDAQKLLERQNLVNAILALECNCAADDRVGQIRADLAKYLPGTQVIERGPPALARAEARNKAKQAAISALEQETANRDTIRHQRENFAAISVPLAVFAAAAWIAVMAWQNVKQRQSEIGILRAIGLRRGQILSSFLARAVLLGLSGAVIGSAVGYGVAWNFIDDIPDDMDGALFGFGTFFVVVCGAMLLSIVASWVPALLAANQDPADILIAD